MNQSILNDKINVLMVGESLDMQGGIASLQKLILTNLDHKINFRHLPTIKTSQSGFTVSKIAFFLKAITILINILLHNEVHLLHIHIAERGAVIRKMIVIIIASFFKKPIILHTHGAEFHQFFDNLPILAQKSVAWAFNKCRFVIVGSNSWREFYVERLKLPLKSVYVNPNPVKIPQHIKPLEDIEGVHEKLNIIFLGRIGRRKGAFELIQAFSRLDNELIEKSHLMLAGDGEIESAKILIQELNMNSSIEVLGWVNSHQRDKLLSSSDIFVLPTYNEILPLALLEAMSWALPVITTPVNGIPEVVTQGQTGLLVEPGNVPQLKDALTDLIQEKALRESLGRSARERVKPFGVEFYCDKLAGIYKTAIQPE